MQARYGGYSGRTYRWQLDQLASHPDYAHIATEDLVALLPPLLQLNLPDSPVARRGIAIGLLNPLIKTELGGGDIKAAGK